MCFLFTSRSIPVFRFPPLLALVSGESASSNRKSAGEMIPRSLRYIWKSYIPEDTPSWSFIKPRLGLTLHGDTILAYLVTPALFMGPLYVRYLQGELPFKRWSFKDVRDTFFTWTGFRNFVVGPVTEELVWRSCIIAIYHLAGVSRNFLIFFTPISFGAAHLHHGWETYCRYGQTRQALQRAIIVTLFQFTYTTLFGFHCAFLFLRTGSVFPPIAAHVFCNLMGVPHYSSEIQWHPERRQQIRATYFMGIVAYILTMRYWTLVDDSLFWFASASHAW